MAVQDLVVDWYIKHIMAPNFADYSKPGFIITRNESKFGKAFQRDVCLPEELILNYESKIIELYGDKGKQYLYGLGKNFGWNFGKALCIPTINSTSESEFINMANFIAKFVGATWAEKCEVEKINVKDHYFEISFGNYIVCSKNGAGYLLNSGSLAGLWGYAVNDFAVEAVQIECEGRKDKKCRTICAPPSMFVEKPKDLFIFSAKVESVSSSSKYLTFNSVRDTKFSIISMKSLIANKVVDYSKGKFLLKGTRLLPLAIDLIFLLESSSKELPKLNDLLFSVAFAEGKEIALKEQKLSPKFISDFLSSCGWGDILITSSLTGLAINYYPWHDLFESCGKEIFLGLMSGMLSVLMKKEVLVKIKSSNLSGGFVSLSLVADFK